MTKLFHASPKRCRSSISASGLQGSVARFEGKWVYAVFTVGQAERIGRQRCGEGNFDIWTFDLDQSLHTLRVEHHPAWCGMEEVMELLVPDALTTNPHRIEEADWVQHATAPGFQADGQGYLWCAVARTSHGRIPGKTKNGVCWYSYGGKEYTTANFDVVGVSNLTKNRPATTTGHGFQGDGAGELWCAVAETQHGKIPGKAKGGTCWYPYGGKEYSTPCFKYCA
eukprot:TRINITY_DN25530_c0_g1_i1.p1 TRINITY_DN25530_c0_g1~~TRINITY_DN25530_c0_g1_i1.p1  ORF type:complete len:225 (-),score=10.92 TRINITY_DN25530_c0_g1_i1:124-798(-)